MWRGQGATPAAFYLGLCRLRGILSPPAPHDCAAGGPFLTAAAMTLRRFASLGLKSRITACWMAFPGKNLQRFPSLGLKSRITAHKKLFPGKNLQRFPNSPPEIKNHCTLYGVSGQKLAPIPKSGPEFKNHCSSKPVLEAGHSSLLQRRLELDAEDLCRYDHCRRNHSLLPQRKLESAAEVVAATSAAGGPFFFAAAKNRIGRGSSLPLRP